MRRLPLLMTASVSTRGMKGASFSAEEREEMYLAAVCYYLEKLPADQPIVFAENSGWDLAAFAKKVCVCHWGEADVARLQGRVELVAVDPGICDQSRGKGYNEVLLMNQAVEKSAFIREAGAFMKVTGRYPILNLPRYLKGARKFFAKGGRYYGDMKDHRVYDFLFPDDTERWNGHAAETALFASTVKFYWENLANSYRDCNDYTNQWLEIVWHRILVPYRKSKDRTVRLRYLVEPQFWGVQGSRGRKRIYITRKEAFKMKLGRFVGNCVRIFMPWFWL